MSSFYMCLDKILILVPLLNAHIISQFQTAIISALKHSTTIKVLAVVFKGTLLDLCIIVCKFP